MKKLTFLHRLTPLNTLLFQFCCFKQLLSHCFVSLVLQNIFFGEQRLDAFVATWQLILVHSDLLHVELFIAFGQASHLLGLLINQTI